jgi:hypothetical protein
MMGVVRRTLESVRSRRVAQWTIGLFAVAASLTGIGNGFALDDVMIIADNERIHSLSSAFRVFGESYWPPEAGASLYRPLTSFAFALQWAVGSGSPLPFHIVSIALYVVVCLAMYRLVRRIADPVSAWIAAALFAVHPLHVEAVANVVGQAELWASLFAILSVDQYVAARRKAKLNARAVAAVAGFFALALLFKEHAIVLPLLIVAAELILFNTGPMEQRARLLAPLGVALALVACAFLVVRTAVLGGIAGGTSPIFYGAGFTTRVFTMLSIVTEWARLFVWPAVLSADYSPSRVVVVNPFHPSILPGIGILALVALLAIRFRQVSPVATFAIAWIAITMLIPSNLFVVTGFVIAERTMFLASVGVTIVAALAFVAVLRDARESHRRVGVALTWGAVVALLAAGVLRSSSRNPVWRDNASLIAQTVLDAPESAQAHMMMAQLHLDRGEAQAALREARVALRLGMPQNPQLYAFVADVYQMNGLCGSATRLYGASLSIRPNQPQVRLNAARCRARARSGPRGVIAEANDVD